MTTETERNTYNGWTNYETWNVKLWLDNDQAEYEHWSALAGAGVSAHQLADMLKREHQDNMPAMKPSTYSDMLQAALDSVNWREIAEALIEDAA